MGFGGLESLESRTESVNKGNAYGIKPGRVIFALRMDRNLGLIRV